MAVGVIWEVDGVLVILVHGNGDCGDVVGLLVTVFIIAVISVSTDDAAAACCCSSSWYKAALWNFGL
jgi:hypothetical protein